MATDGQFYWPPAGIFVAAYGQFFMAANNAAATYRCDGRTDAKDARIIAYQARMHTKSVADPWCGPDQRGPAAPDGPAYGSDLRLGPDDQPASGYFVGVLPCARAGVRLLEEEAPDPVVRLSGPGGHPVRDSVGWQVVE
jgi:hypothetical protein